MHVFSCTNLNTKIDAAICFSAILCRNNTGIEPAVIWAVNTDNGTSGEKSQCIQCVYFALRVADYVIIFSCIKWNTKNDTAVFFQKRILHFWLGKTLYPCLLWMPTMGHLVRYCSVQNVCIHDCALLPCTVALSLTHSDTKLTQQFFFSNWFCMEEDWGQAWCSYVVLWQSRNQ